MTSATAASLGTNVSVTSWIWVTDWNSEMARPMARLVRRIGAETLAVTIIILRAISITAVSVMRRGAPRRRVLRPAMDGRSVGWRRLTNPLVEARQEGLDDQCPAVHQHEQQDLEGQ